MQSDGSVHGDAWGECDTRFSLCAVACLALIVSCSLTLPSFPLQDRLACVDTSAICAHVLRCHNFDGGFGTRPGSESHAGMVYCCVATLAVCGRLGDVDADRTGAWLARRQLPSGGLNGRPEKLPDVCYSWWVLTSAAILGRAHWIDGESLARFILAAQDADTGGFADRPEDMVGDLACVITCFSPTRSTRYSA